MASRSSRGNTESISAGALLACGAFLVAASAAFATLSGAFVPGVGHEDRPIPELVIAWIAAGGSWAAAVGHLAGRRGPRGLGALVLVVTLAAAGLHWKARPVEDPDTWRRILDGAVTACGEDPYALTPSAQLRALKTVAALQRSAPEPESQPASEFDVDRLLLRPELDPQVSDPDVPCLHRDPALMTVATRVPEPGIRSFTPPLAALLQGRGVAALGVRPEAARAVSLGGFLAAIAALALLLARTRLDFSALLVLAWSPLAINSFANGTDTGSWALALTMLAFVLADRGNGFAAGISAGAAVCVDPIAIWPLAAGLRSLPDCPRPQALGAALLVPAASLAWFGWGAAATLVPWQRPVGDWTDSAPLFGILRTAAGWTGLDPVLAGAAAFGVSALVPLLILWASRGDGPPLERAGKAALPVTAAALIVSPSAPPAAWTWLLPWLVFAPAPAWRALLAAMPLYLGGFWLEYRGMGEYSAAATYAPYVTAALVLIVTLRSGPSPAAGGGPLPKKGRRKAERVSSAREKSRQQSSKAPKPQKTQKASSRPKKTAEARPQRKRSSSRGRTKSDTPPSPRRKR